MSSIDPYQYIIVSSTLYFEGSLFFFVVYFTWNVMLFIPDHKMFFLPQFSGRAEMWLIYALHIIQQFLQTALILLYQFFYLIGESTGLVHIYKTQMSICI